VAISAYEAEMNLIIHADQGGELIAELTRTDHLTVVDHRRVADVEALSLAFNRPNWIQSSALVWMERGNIKRCADSMKLESNGQVLGSRSSSIYGQNWARMLIHPRRSARRRYDFFERDRRETESGASLFCTIS
jgi:hypothetical protein